MAKKHLEPVDKISDSFWEHWIARDMIRVHDIHCQELLHYWELGSFVDDLEQRPDFYRPRTVENLANEVGEHIEDLRLYHLLYQTFTPEELEDLSEHGVTCAHLKQFMQISDREQRRKALREALGPRMTEAEEAKFIKHHASKLVKHHKQKAS